MIVVGPAAPVPLLLPVHDLLNAAEVGIGNQRLVDDAAANYFVGSAGDLSPVSLAPVNALVPTSRRRVPLLVDHPHAGPNGIPHDHVHSPRRNAHHLGQLQVTLLTGEELPKGVSHALGLSLVVETAFLVVPD